MAKIGGVASNPIRDPPIQLPEEVHPKPSSKKMLCLKLVGVISACMLVALMVVLYMVFSTTDQRKCDESNRCKPFGNDTNYDESNCRDALNYTICTVDNQKSNQTFVCCNSPTDQDRSNANEADIKNIIPTHSPVPTAEFECGKGAINRIVGGQNAELFEFPWMAMLFRNDSNTSDVDCGGSIIDEQHVLTSAHCIKQYINEISSFEVRLGEYDRSSEIDCIPSDEDADCDPTYQDFKIEAVAVHPNFNARDNLNDIALLKLDKPATFNYYVRPICLPENDSLVDDTMKSMFIAGWGEVHNAVRPQVLQHAKVDVFQNSTECFLKYKEKYPSFKPAVHHICAGGNGSANHCHGDSGGPLMYVAGKHNVYYQYAIISRGVYSCTKASLPGLYTKVGPYVEWIWNTINTQ